MSKLLALVFSAVTLAYLAEGATLADVEEAIEREALSLRVEGVQEVKLSGYDLLGREDLTAEERACVCGLVNLAPSQINEVLVPEQLELREEVPALLTVIRDYTVQEVAEAVEETLLEAVRPVVRGLVKRMKKCT